MNYLATLPIAADPMARHSAQSCLDHRFLQRVGPQAFGLIQSLRHRGPRPGQLFFRIRAPRRRPGPERGDGAASCPQAPSQAIGKLASHYFIGLASRTPRGRTREQKVHAQHLL